MNVPILSTLTIVIYFSASFIQSLGLYGRLHHSKWCVLGFGLLAICLHALLLHVWIDVAGGQNLNIFNMLSLALWLIAVLTCVIAMAKPVDLLVTLIFPLAAISMLLVLVFPREYIVNTVANSGALFHIVLSILTVGVLGMAALVAVILAIQESVLRYKQCGWLISGLPPLESVERLLFQMISLGFILLTVVLVSSFYFYYGLLFTHLLLLQKAALAVLAWVIFAVLLGGRYWRGWRSRKAIYYTLAGVGLLVIAYFGSKLVLEALH